MRLTKCCTALKTTSRRLRITGTDMATTVTRGNKQLYSLKDKTHCFIYTSSSILTVHLNVVESLYKVRLSLGLG